MAPKLYMFITVVMSVRVGKPLLRLISLVKDNEPRINLVGYDEELRRVVVRGDAREAPYLKKLVEEYAQDYSFEVKSTLSMKVTPAVLKKVDALYRVTTQQVILFYVPCSNKYAVYGEAKGRKVLLKLCRKTASIDPAAIPPGLCSFTSLDLDMVEAVNLAEKCFRSIASKLHEARESA